MVSVESFFSTKLCFLSALEKLYWLRGLGYLNLTNLAGPFGIAFLFSPRIDQGRPAVFNFDYFTVKTNAHATSAISSSLSISLELWLL